LQFKHRRLIVERVCTSVAPSNSGNAQRPAALLSQQTQPVADQKLVLDQRSPAVTLPCENDAGQQATSTDYVSPPVEVKLLYSIWTSYLVE